jgi:hypothetical protein
MVYRWCLHVGLISVSGVYYYLNDHNRQFPEFFGHLTGCNFITRVLYKDTSRSGNRTHQVDQDPVSDGQSKVLGSTARRRYTSWMCTDLVSSAHPAATRVARQRSSYCLSAYSC